MINPYISLAIGILCISIFPVLIKWAPVSGVTSAFYRMFIALIILLPYMYFQKKLHVIPKKLWLPVSICGILFGTDIAIWNLSIQYSNATQATLLTNLSPIWVGVGSFLFLSHKPNKQFWIGTLVALFGMCYLIGFDTLRNLEFNLGFGLALLSGILYACYMIVSKSVLQKLDILPFLTFSILVSSLYLLLICLAFKQPLWGFELSIWGILMVQGIICQLLGWIAISFATKKLDTQSVSLSLLSQAVVTALLAWLFIGEKITLQMIIGGAIILIGISITFMHTQKQDVPKSQI
jgi:drug/metabolite transporter (DMT)-like permease